MDYRKLFHVLVVGGALAGGTACNESAAAAKSQGDKDKAGPRDGGTAPRDGGEAPKPGGGGVKGW